MDYDGTLAPIVDDPAEAQPEPGAVEVLRRLATRLGQVAVVSGRPVSYLAAQLHGAGRVRLLGLYGLERSEGGRIETVPEAERFRPAADAAASDAESRLPAPLQVERKGLTVTLHYRADPSHARLVEGLAAELAWRYGLAAHDGKMSVELRPPLAVDKGTVVSGLAGGLEAVLFAGDDLGDLPAFEALRRLAGSGVRVLAVASGGPETHPDVLGAADVTVDGPSGLVSLLTRVADEVGA